MVTIIIEDRIFVENLKTSVYSEAEWLISIRRHLHAHPELSTCESDTQTFIMDTLQTIGVDVIEPSAETGVLGIIYGKGRGPTIGIRADIDALPLNEAWETAYKSQNNDTMHACGHDAHAAILLGTAKVLCSFKDELNGNVKLFFEPAEETIGGAATMVKEGCMKDPDVDYVIGLHVMPHLSVGEVEVKYDQLNAAADSLTIDINGKASHGAYPHRGTDAIVAASQVISALQAIVSRAVPPTEPAVLTLGTIKGGVKNNIVADHVRITGTLRTLTLERKSELQKKVTAIVENIATALGAEGTVRFASGYPPLINDREVVDVIKGNAESLLGEDSVILLAHPSMGGEDFSYFLEGAKGAFFHLGCGHEDLSKRFPLHSPLFNLDERCLSIGVQLQVLNVFELMSRKK